MADKTEPDEATFLADALQQVQAGTALLIDVRTAKEWDEAHFAIAKHIPIDKIKEDAEAAFGEIEKEQTVFIHWRSGGRAGQAAELLTEMGYKVVPMGMKYEAIKEAGFKESPKN
jgi:rhodanese-related sulfurtransferase